VVVFIFGTAGPGIKLMAMKGVPWTKTWGAMFLASFIAVEGLVILSWILRYTRHCLDPLNIQRIKERLKHIDFMLLAFSACFYDFTLFWAMLDIHDGCDPYGSSLAAGPWTFPLKLLLGLWVMALSLALGGTLLLHGSSHHIPNQLTSQQVPSKYHPPRERPRS
jgi:hypothetical protein